MTGQSLHLPFAMYPYTQEHSHLLIDVDICSARNVILFAENMQEVHKHSRIHPEFLNIRLWIYMYILNRVVGNKYRRILVGAKYLRTMHSAIQQ